MNQERGYSVGSKKSKTRTGQTQGAPIRELVSVERQEHERENEVRRLRMNLETQIRR